MSKLTSYATCLYWGNLFGFVLLQFRIINQCAATLLPLKGITNIIEMVLVLKEQMGADFCSFLFLFFNIFPRDNCWQSVTTLDQITGTERKKRKEK